MLSMRCVFAMRHFLRSRSSGHVRGARESGLQPQRRWFGSSEGFSSAARSAECAGRARAAAVSC
eukprot:14694422-Alexandrium_andersonii.AAC.1